VSRGKYLIDAAESNNVTSSNLNAMFIGSLKFMISKGAKLTDDQTVKYIRELNDNYDKAVEILENK